MENIKQSSTSCNMVYMQILSKPLCNVLDEFHGILNILEINRVTCCCSPVCTKTQIDLAKTQTSESEQINRVSLWLQSADRFVLGTFSLYQEDDARAAQLDATTTTRTTTIWTAGEEPQKLPARWQAWGAGAAITDYATPTRSLSCCWLQCSIDADFPSLHSAQLIYRSACLSFSHSLQLLRLQAHAFANVLLLPCSRPALFARLHNTVQCQCIHTHTRVRFCDFHFHFPRSFLLHTLFDTFGIFHVRICLGFSFAVCTHLFQSRSPSLCLYLSDCLSVVACFVFVQFALQLCIYPSVFVFVFIFVSTLKRIQFKFCLLRFPADFSHTLLGIGNNKLMFFLCTRTHSSPPRHTHTHTHTR